MTRRSAPLPAAARLIAAGRYDAALEALACIPDGECAEAARLLVERLKNRERPIETVQLKSSLQIRDSCGYSLKAVAV